MTPLKLTSTLLTITLLTSSAQAGFHLMQIEEIIGGVNGNTAAQAIQLRLRSAGQTVVGGTTLIASDATGLNPITLLSIPASVANGAAGANILLTTTAFNTLMSAVPSYTSDFTLAAPIPSSYLSGGKLTFQSGSTIYWSVAFGAYTGTNTGSTTNDADGNFGSPTFALPTSSLQGIRFTGTAAALSTTNVADYALTTNPATVRNNAGTPFTVVPEPGSLAFVGIGALALAGTVFGRRRSLPRRD